MVLAVVIALQLRPVSRRSPATVRAFDLSGSFPTAVAGWEVRDVPLGPTEFLSEETKAVLNFDQVLFREYSSAAGKFAVYVAYWQPGKVPTQVVASHNPDRCWVSGADWRCEQKDVKALLPGLEEHQLPGAQKRVYRSPRGEIQHVVFWHLVGAKVFDASDRFGSIPNPVYWWREVIRQMATGAREQCFVRISSAKPLEQIWEQTAFQEVLRALRGVGLGAPESSLQ